jgi:hypothetical protein
MTRREHSARPHIGFRKWRVSSYLQRIRTILRAVLTACHATLRGDFMRTTVTINADTEALLKEEASRTGQSFKVVLNPTQMRQLLVTVNEFLGRSIHRP